MKLTNDRYLILIGTKNFTEKYYRDRAGWLKVSSRGKKFRMTAEQVLNHLLPAAAGVKKGLILTVKHKERRVRKTGGKEDFGPAAKYRPRGPRFCEPGSLL